MKIVMPSMKLWLHSRCLKSNDDEISVRRTAIRSATLKATEKPFETAELALMLLKLLPELASKGNANAVSDVGVAGLLASAACKGALFNVDINLGSLPEGLCFRYSKECSSYSRRMPIIIAQSNGCSKREIVII